MSQVSEPWLNLTNGDSVRGIGGSRGTVWVATNGGLVAVDEASGMQRFYTRANSGLTSNGLLALHVAASGDIWVLMGSNQRSYGAGLARFDGSSWTILGTNDPRLPFEPAGLLTDNREDLWMYNWGYPQRLAMWDGATWRVVEADSAVEGSRVTGIVLDDRGELWFTVYPWDLNGRFHGGGLVHRSHGTWTTYTPDNSELTSSFLTSLALDHDGALWIGALENQWLDPDHPGGVTRYDGSTWTHYDPSNSGLSSEYVRSVVIDRGGVKWVGTFEGLFRFDGVDWTRYDTENSALPGNLITQLYLDSEDRLWIGTWNAGLARFDRGSWTAYDTSNSPLPYNAYAWTGQSQISAIERDPDGSMWMGLRGAGIMRAGEEWTLYNGSNSALPFSGLNDDVLDIAIGADRRVWVATFSGVAAFDGVGWHAYDSSNSPIATNASCIAVDSLGVVWLGTSHGLARFDGSTWALYTPANSGLPAELVAALAVDRDGSLLVSAWGFDRAFIVRFDGRNWTQIPLAPEALVSRMLVDDAGDLWAAGRAVGGPFLGLARFDGAEWTFYNTKNSGIPIDEVESLAQSGPDIWIGTCGGGVARFDRTHWQVFNVTNSGVADDYCIHAIESDVHGDIWIGDQNGGLSIYKPGPITPVELAAFEAVPTDQGVVLTWRFGRSALQDLLGIGVQRSERMSGPFATVSLEPLPPASSMRFVDSGVEANVTYWYRLDLQHRDGRRSQTLAIQTEFRPAGMETSLEAPAIVELGKPVSIRYRLGSPAMIDLALFDVRGRKLASLSQGPRAAGSYSMTWDGSANGTREQPRGVVFLRLDARSRPITRKVLLVKP